MDQRKLLCDASFKRKKSEQLFKDINRAAREFYKVFFDQFLSLFGLKRDNLTRQQSFEIANLIASRIRDYFGLS